MLLEKCIFLVAISVGIKSYNESYNGLKYGSTFSFKSPGRKPNFSPASTAGRDKIIRSNLFSNSCETAVSQLLENKFDRIILSRPAVEAGEKLGFLPGDLKEKVDPYLRPLYDSLYDLMPTEIATRKMHFSSSNFCWH